MNVEKLEELISKAEMLHKDFERLFLKLYEYANQDYFKGISEVILKLHELSDEKFETASQIYKVLASVGGNLEKTGRELQKNEHQMRFRIEEIITLLGHSKGSFSEKLKTKAALQRLFQFHRIYDYSVTQTLQKLSAEIDSLIFISEKEKKSPTSIIERLKKIEDLEEKLNTLTTFVFHIYSHPSWVHKVEESLREWHSKGLLWVESRNVEQNTGIDRVHVAQILEGLTLIGIVEKKKRGGESVYKLRGFGED
ncbi:hypothetical protein [Thermococcus paralvinellae]|uniref:Uncharacterized protein n=1 Tax=Thermococcus paralvinellae TaxID=582419 RepID=W0I7G4_9EURY|nr:hypothetical protein [Thermococcus paralvinellae]AHF80405.1 Hypothetical protein TES1_1021 [Thermococcus paralvinellae]